MLAEAQAAADAGETPVGAVVFDPATGQVVAKALAEAKVVVGGLRERAHRPAPGHGWATLRSDVKSTFA